MCAWQTSAVLFRGVQTFSLLHEAGKDRFYFFFIFCGMFSNTNEQLYIDLYLSVGGSCSHWRQSKWPKYH